MSLIEWQCQTCGRTYKIKETAESARCSCGSSEAFASKVNRQDLPCVYRGKVIREINCGCEGKPKLLECEKHGSCFLRKLPKMKADAVAGSKMCLDCDDRKYYRPNRVGLLLTCFNVVGGVETWARILIDHALPGMVSGIASIANPTGKANLPAYNGEDAINELFNCSDFVFVWGVDKLPDGVEKTKPCIAIHHGSEISTWANGMFAEQLKWCDGGVAINPEVSKMFNVPYLPNPIANKKDVSKVAHDGVNVLWNHRWAGEKRPHLMKQIAELLPSEYKMLVSAPIHEDLPANCVNIGLNADNSKHLAAADVFLSTADQEAFGYSIAEAVLAKVPVVAAPLGLAKSLAAQLVESDDPSDWAEAILAAERENDDLEGRRELLLGAHGEPCYDIWRKFVVHQSSFAERASRS